MANISSQQAFSDTAIFSGIALKTVEAILMASSFEALLNHKNKRSIACSVLVRANFLNNEA